MAASKLKGDGDGSESGRIIAQAQSRSVANISNGERVGVSVDIANGKMKKVRQKCSESRKIRKPLMEKKRRARINHSLNELKRILLEANGAPTLSKEGSRPTKLEKADILELTVTYLQALQEQQPKPSSINSHLNGAPVMSSSQAQLTTMTTANVSSTLTADLEMDMNTDGGSQSGQWKQAVVPAMHLNLLVSDRHDLSNSSGLTTSDSSFTNGFTKCTKLVKSDLHKNLRPKSPKSRKQHQQLKLKLDPLVQQQHLDDLVIPQSKSDSGVGRVGHVKEENNNEQPELPIDGNHDDISVNAYLVPTRLANGTLVFAVKCHHGLGHGVGRAVEEKIARACENLHSSFCLTEAEPYHYPTQSQNLSSPESVSSSPSRINGDGDSNNGHDDHESVKMEMIWRPW